MRKNDRWSYIAGFVTGVIVAVIIATWGEAAIAYRIVYMVLLSFLLLAAWSKPNPYKGNHNANNNHLDVPIVEATDKGSDGTT
jgi:hypothetical protein